MVSLKVTQNTLYMLTCLTYFACAEIANVALFLASDESSYVNGQAWAVDAGLSSSHPHVPGKMA